MNEVKLTVKLTRPKGAVRLDYSVANPGPGPVYVFNALWQPGADGRPQADPNSAYTTVRPDGLLVVAQVVYPVPKLKDVELRLVPFARRLGPGLTLWGEVVLDPPVKEYSPYYPEEADATWKDATAARLEFRLDWVAADPALVVHDTPLVPAVRLEHPRLLALVQTLTAPPTAVTVPVRVRQDTFERL